MNNTFGSRSVPRPSKQVEVAVIGAGIAGCTVAYELAKRGVKVALLDQGPIAAGSSGRNTGTLLQQPEPEVASMLRRTVEIYREIAADPLDFEFREHLQLLLAGDASQLDAARARAEGLALVGVRSEPIDAGTMRSEFPALGSDLAGGYVVPGAWMLAPETATRAFAEAARRHGAIVRTGMRVDRLPALSGRLAGGLLTDDGVVSADAVVVAAGPWLPDLLPQCPVASGRGWLMRTATLPWRLPWIIEEISWPDQDVLGSVTRSPTLSDVAQGDFGLPVVEAFVLAPLADGSAHLGASLAPSLRDAVEGVEAPRLLATHSQAIAPALSNVPVTRAWSGLRPMTPDGLPMAGRTLIEGVWLHGGHGSLGMQAAPATGEWLAEAMIQSSSSPDMSWLAPERFASTSRSEEA